MSRARIRRPAGLLLVSLLTLAGCGGGGGGGGSPPPAVTSYTISGSVSGLSGTGLVLRNNGADNLPVSTTNFTFSTPVTNGGAYSVTVFAQPTGQTCNVTNGSGAVGNANVTNVQVSCGNNPAPGTNYTIGGTISGLTGNGLVLRNNGGDNLALSPASATSTFTFNTAIANGNPYNVTVFTQPTGQFCNVTGGSGTVASANVSNVQVNCVANTYTISGNVSGLTGSGLVLQNNGGDNRAIAANGAFTFATALASGSYSVTVLAQPGGPSQTCTVVNGSGTLAGANITNVQVNCVTNSYTISGSVTGLTGSGLVLQNNGADNRAVSANGAFTFISAIASGSGYNVTVFTQPTGQTCTPSNNSGTVVSAPITNVQVNCTNNPTFTIGGSVTGLTGSGLVLQNNGGNNLAVSTGSFTFTTAIASGNSYNVTVLTHPSSQTCTVTNGSGTVAGANVATVQVNCATPVYTVGGSVTGLTGSGLVLQNNGGDNRAISADGAFVFATALADLSSYSVTVLTQPTGQTCTVSSGSGAVASANVTTVAVSCANIATYTIGGAVTNLVGSGLVLQNNGGNNLPVSTSPFTFSTPILNGSPYSVTILTQPSGQTCTVTNGSGTVAGAAVTNVQLNCVTNTYTISGIVSGLTGSGLILRNNGGDNRSITANGAFAFNTAIASGNPYSVTVFTQAIGQNCTVSNNSGTVAGANITNVQVNCVVTSTYTISGNVSGPLSGTPFPLGGILTLQNNGGDPISLTNYGAFTFPTAVASGLTYNVTVSLQPATDWTCVPTRASGVVAAANITNVQVSCVDNTVVPTGSMGVARNHHSATLLANGKVMVAGGWTTSAAVPLLTAEIFDPAGAGTFTATGSPMSTARTNHTATPIAGGKVLVAGGSNGVSNLNSAEVFDPAGAGTFSATGLMNSSRLDHTAALLADGRVLIAGGYGGAGSPVASAEIYDPAGAGTFTATAGPMGTARTAHSATFLPLTGTVLIVGGQDANAELSSAEIFNPAAGGTFSATGAMGAIRRNHTATLLLDGKVLIVGGKQNSDNPIASAEVYDPSTGTFHATGGMAAARGDHTATLLANGKVLVTGGCTGSSCTGTLKTMEIYDPASGLFANAGSMSSPRANHTATRLWSNSVLITGGFDSTPVVNAVVNTADLVPQ